MHNVSQNWGLAEIFDCKFYSTTREAGFMPQYTVAHEAFSSLVEHE